MNKKKKKDKEEKKIKREEIKDEHYILSKDCIMTPSSSSSIDLAGILRAGLPAYIARYGPLPEKQWKVVNHIMHCRSAAMGARVYTCNQCDYTTLLYNSCKDRHCPQCQGIARATWVQKRLDDLLPVGYFHVVFTLPDSLNPFVLRNKRVLYDMLFAASSAALLQLSADPRWLGAVIGCIAVLHTWGQNLMDHPHIHCIIPAGGLKKNLTEWKYFRPDFLFPTAVLGTVFQGKFLAAFQQAIAAGQIQLPGVLQQYTNPACMQAFIAAQYHKEWVVYIKEPFASPDQVIKYLGRYTHRIALSNNRLIGMENARVSFWYKDYRDNSRQKVMSLEVVELIRRFLLHVLPQGYVRIRYYGILSNRTKKQHLHRCFSLLQQRWEPRFSLGGVIGAMLLIFGVDISKCPQCATGRLQPGGDTCTGAAAALRDAA